MCLSSGDDRASTCRVGSNASTCAGVSLRKSGPSMARPPGVSIPHSFAMAFAVSMLSPVTIRTKIPAL